MSHFYNTIHHLHLKTTSNITYIIHLTPRLPLSYSMRTRILFVTVTIYQDIFFYIISHLKVYLINHVYY